jgi:hypothetical protein
MDKRFVADLIFAFIVAAGASLTLYRLFSDLARSRTPFSDVMSGAFRSACACFGDSQLPKRIPLEATPFTRVMPLASSGASKPFGI